MDASKGQGSEPPIELILGNTNARFSGVTSTMLQVLAVQKNRIPLAVLGAHHLPEDVRTIGFWQLVRLSRRPLPGGRWRVFHARRNDEMILAIVARDLFKAKIKIAFTSTAQRRKTWITRWLMRRMDGLLTTCNAAAAYMPTRPDRMIPHGINANLYRPAEDPAGKWRELGLPGRYGIGIFGRVRYQKGVDLLIDSIIPLLPEFPDFTLVVVGEVTSDQRDFVEAQRRKLEAAGLADRVVWTGELPFDHIPDYFKAMSIVTALSRNEGFGLTTLEAMSSGVPVIATEAGAWPDIIEQGREGFLIEVNDRPALTGKLRLLMADDALRRDMGVRGREKVLRDYTVEREAESLLDYYQTLANSET